jgi:cell wall-associated NlpC family hydrolase
MTVSLLLKADPSSISASAAGFNGWLDQVDASKAHLTGQVVEPTGWAWAGPSHVAAQGTLDQALANMTASGKTITDIESTLHSSATKIRDAQNTAANAVSSARAQGFTVLEDGTVTPAKTSATTSTNAAENNATQAARLQKELKGALADATAADSSAAAALRDLHPPSTTVPRDPSLSGYRGVNTGPSTGVVPTGFTNVPPAAGKSLGAQIVNYGRNFLGLPYVWAGKSPTSGFDCSGLVQYVYAHFGIHLPRTADLQADVGPKFTDPGQLRPGDLVFSGWDPSEVGANGVGHVGIYAGNGWILEASQTGVPIHYVKLNSTYLAHVKWFTRPTA